MLHVALYQPEIPPNTGNIIRLCANTGAQLHLIHPLGFSLNDTQLKRAGLDYHEWATIKTYANYTDFKQHMTQSRIIACSTKAKINYSDFSYQHGDVLLFGPETRGLPTSILEEIGDNRQLVRIPMKAESRSLNLANAAAVILYEGWRQLSFSD